MDTNNIAMINNIIINGKIVDISVQLRCFFFMSLVVKSFEIFPKHNRYDFI